MKKVGVIGCGGIGGVHLSQYAKVDGLTLAAVCDSDPAKAQKAGETHGVPFYTSHQEMLEKESLDAVDICTPPAFHYQAAMDAIDKGCAVLCEKPMAVSVEQGKAMVEAAARKGVFLMAAFCHRFHEPVALAKAAIESGKLGKVVSFRNRFAGKFAGVENTWFSKKEISGGGNFMDTTVHSIDLFRFLTGEVVNVVAKASTSIPGISVEDTGVMLLESENGTIGTLECSWLTPNSENIVEIYGDRGTAIVDYNRGGVRIKGADDADWGQPELTLPEWDHRFHLEIQHFGDVLNGKASPKVSGFDGLRAIEIIAQAYASVNK
ncbi:MAG: Gfo/Idh/MocA family oxidoreductase [Armatimonadetes bacterium]|nr:Gfo/Idh/MocA family oxidoreductase [Armatimonadota bacterium]